MNSSVASRHHEGIAGIRNPATLSPVQARHISIYIDLLLRWNARINLTAVREPDRIVTRHFGESIFVARHLFPQAEVGAGVRPHVIDVGSGAGFPGLPIKIWAPHIHLTLIESSQKKATFLREVVRGLGLSNVDVFAGRAEAFPGHKGDVVTFRAVERFESVLQVAAGLLADSGCLAILLGGSQRNGVRALLPALQWEEPVSLPLSSNRAMIIGRKES
ncbi:MAG: 16S rRNA (guanine(527)-N(7))-methyltransferase RsmG [Terriglobales bacterium]